MKNWKKHGIVISPDKRVWWRETHCMIPTPEQVSGSLYKIYFSGRNNQNQSHIGYALVDLENPSKVIEYSAEPVLAPGSLGCFDDNGVTPSCILKSGTETLLFYIGWNPGSTTRMHIFGGLALSQDGGKSFQRYSRAPIIERNRVNPYINTAPFVIDEGDHFKMYYVSGVEWVHRDLPRYNIQMAYSRNGKDWVREGKVCIDFENGENALARPYVLKEDGIYKMWFAAKGEAYRLHYAESEDGVNWTRKNEMSAFNEERVPAESDMIEYAAVITYNGRKYMYYNGNNYGSEGILLAVSEPS